MPFSLDQFPLDSARPRQPKVIDYILSKYAAGFRDIFIEAPTGSGKSLIGISAAFHLMQCVPISPGGEDKPKEARGAYYAVTQKALQKQLVLDVPRFRPTLQNVHSLKSSEEYPCSTYKNCGAGSRRVAAEGDRKKKRCESKVCGTCPYDLAKKRFLASDVAVTNYAFLLAAKMYTDMLPMRQVAIYDECHGLEEQLIKFIDASVDIKQLTKWTDLRSIPKFASVIDWSSWLTDEYLPRAQSYYDAIVELSDPTEEQDSEVVALDKHICKLNRAARYMLEQPDEWVQWRDDGPNGTMQTSRPISAAMYADEMTRSNMAHVRIYMSAYPGTKAAVCRSLGLSESEVAWGAIGSDFPARNRQVLVYPRGSMAMRSKEETLPKIAKTIALIAGKHATRGLIHCVSYDTGKAIYDELEKSGFGDRLIFPKADGRDAALAQHRQTEGAILISPSMTEGFDFPDDAARWQVIAKVPWPMLGDPQIVAKKKRDPDWYMMRTFMTILQMCGRICRSQTDYGVTYVLDSDFLRFWSQYKHMMPAWFVESVVIKN